MFKSELKPVDRLKFKATSNTPLPEAARPADLQQIATRHLPGCMMYTRQDIITLLSSGAGITQARAENGFKALYEAGAIEQTLNPDYFYLSGSTPF